LVLLERTRLSLHTTKNKYAVLRRLAGRASRYASNNAPQIDLDRSLRVARRRCNGGGPQDGHEDLARRDRRGTAGAEMKTKADQAVDRAADHIQEMADKAAAEGG